MTLPQYGFARSGLKAYPWLIDYRYVLVTGATGFIGAHIVDQLLQRGIKVRGTTRSTSKARWMKNDRPQYASQLDFVQIEDFTGNTDFHEAVQGIDAIIHTASPLTYDTTDNEKELILPAINGVEAVLSAAAKTGKVRRVVLTSSFAAVVDIEKKTGSDFTYTGEHWNPLTYEHAIAPETSAVVAYRGSKKFAELEAWNFVKHEKPEFDLVTLCPPMTFGPIAHPVKSASELNESNAKLWDLATGKPLPEQRVPVWIDVRDLAQAHVEALVRPEAGGKRYAIASSEKWSYEMAAMILRREYPQLKDQVVTFDDVKTPESYNLESSRVSEDLGIHFRSFKSSVTDLFGGLQHRGLVPWKD